MKILLYPNEILLKPTKKIKDFNEIKEIQEQMKYLMEKTKGVGLAAPQVGISIKMFITKNIQKQTFKTIANPKIIHASSEKIEFEEGCLSFPSFYVKTERSKIIQVEYQNETGKTIKEELSGIDSVCFQHEKDHIDNILILDHMRTKQRKKTEKLMKKVKQELLITNPDIYY